MNWRDSDTSRAPAQARLFRDAHQRLEALANEAGLGPSDVVIHDLGRAELRGIWGNEEVVLVVEEIGESSPPVSAPNRKARRSGLSVNSRGPIRPSERRSGGREHAAGGVGAR